MLQRLSHVSVGQKATIRSFEKDEIFLKLMEMGCVPGESVTIDLIAPLGDPISISVAGYSLSLRLEEADKIWVEVINDAAPPLKLVTSPT
jgi:ferrous iron transport protein A